MGQTSLTREELDRFVDEQAPFVRALGITCEALGAGHAVARMKADPRWLRPGNILIAHATSSYVLPEP